jgi:hypothetical protein
LNVISIESARLQESHLPGLLVEIGWLLGTKLLNPHLASRRVPILIRVLQAIFGHAAGDTTLAKIGAYPDRPFALIDSRRNERFNEALITLQVVFDQLRYRFIRSIRSEAEAAQLLQKFSPTVLAPGEIIHRLLARLDRVRKLFVVYCRASAIEMVG